MFGYIYESKLSDKINSHCGVPMAGYSDWLTGTNFLLPYTGVAGIDAPGICGLTVFFHVLMDSPKKIRFIEYFVATGAPYVLITVVEGSRQGQSLLLRFPAICLLSTQFLSFGASYPIACLLWVVTGSMGRAREFTVHSFNRAQGESLVFGMLVGGVLPSLAMFAFDIPIVTWVWQLFPIYVSIAQRVYLQIRSTSNSVSGYPVVRILYITTFLLSAGMHLHTIWSHNNNTLSIVQFLYPSTKLLHPSTDIDLQVLHFLTWDYNLGYAAACVALLWYAQNVWHIFAMISWYAFATPLLGLGTAFMGVAMWRDGIV